MDRAIERVRKFQTGELPGGPVVELLGLTITEVEHGRLVMEMESGPAFANPMGTMHGGILTALADSAMGMAYVSTLGEEESFTTLELKINFLKPVWRGRLTAEARLKKGGSTVGLVECDVRDARGSLVAYAVSTCMTLRGEQAMGRMPAA
ncbi:MAG TPA: PaaI family thioesterase [Dehalococcoidia bacterium]|nr:PaaI family thioesterase [Dehalococcoidia bacterium]